jgi:hypothetical protein
MGDQGACKRPQGTTATSMGARADLGGSEQQGRQARNGPVVRRRSRPDGARREEGADSEAASVGACPGEGWPRDAGGPCDNPPRKIPYYRLRPIHFGR